MVCKNYNFYVQFTELVVTKIKMLREMRLLLEDRLEN